MDAPVSAEEAEALFQPLADFPRLAIAVSGGADSLALLYLLHRWRGGTLDARRTPQLSVLTVDHGLRPQAAAEAALVAEFAHELEVPQQLLEWRDGASATTALQARARAARYGLMTDFCHANAIPALAVAHHLDDQAETLLMRLKRGSGLDGLAAIPPRGQWAGITILRPLLDVPKARLVATLQAAGISWAEDASNHDSCFERARLRLRQEAVAALGLTPVSLARSVRRLQRARAALDGVTQHFLRQHVDSSAAGYATLALDVLLSAPEEIGLRALGRLIAMIGGGNEPVRLAKVEALFGALRREPDKTRTLAGCRLAPRRGRLGLFREIRKPGLPVLRLEPGEQALWDNRFWVALDADQGDAVTVRPLGEEAWRQCRGEVSWLETLPRLASAGLPSCWRNQRLLSVSCHGLGPQGGEGLSAFTARFVHEGFLDRGLGA